MNDEVWANIEGYPGYAISDQGRVMNLKLNKILEGKLQGGKMVVSIQSDEGLSHRFTIDRLMYMRTEDSNVMGRRILIVEDGRIFNSVHEVARALRTETSSVYRFLRGERKTVGGVTLEYVWE